MKVNVALAAPLHDPSGRILKLLDDNAKKLVRLYGGRAAVSTSPTTLRETIKKLESLGFTVNENSNDNIGDNYKLAIKTALDFDPASIHQIDFDRALHWARRFPNELTDIIEYLPSCSGFVSFKRTNRAFETHPLIQRTSEIIVNEIASEVAKKEVDIMSGSYGFDVRLSKQIVKELKRKDFGIYAEFLMIALKHKAPIEIIEVEGLEWETPDQFKDKIEHEGYSKWLSEFQSLSQWQRRVKLVEESTDVLT